jgi:hypothetical protein
MKVGHGGWEVCQFEYRQAWPLGPLCGTLQNVAKPELVIESKPEDNFLRARCSACPSVRFNVVGNTLADKTHLRQMFDIHFRQVHPSQGLCEVTTDKASS